VTRMTIISVRKSALSVFAATVVLFSMSAFSFNPPTDPSPDPDPNPCQTDCGFTRGPNPSESYLEASSGPYSVQTIDVSRSASGFGGGTIHYPAGTTGEMGTIAIVPGFLAPESSIQWWGPRWHPTALSFLRSVRTQYLISPVAGHRSLRARWTM